MHLVTSVNRSAFMNIGMYIGSREESSISSKTRKLLPNSISARTPKPIFLGYQDSFYECIGDLAFVVRTGLMPAVWLAQCLCESNESLPYRNLVETAKAEEQRIRIRTFQGASIDAENLNPLGRHQLFRLL